jgi:hypothetical protein
VRCWAALNGGEKADHGGGGRGEREEALLGPERGATPLRRGGGGVARLLSEVVEAFQHVGLGGALLEVAALELVDTALCLIQLVHQLATSLRQLRHDLAPSPLHVVPLEQRVHFTSSFRASMLLYLSLRHQLCS